MSLAHGFNHWREWVLLILSNSTNRMRFPQRKPHPTQNGKSAALIGLPKIRIDTMVRNFFYILIFSS
ncbi:MAG: hypothetical protein DRI65_03375 [Chloroflexota bacterium]|nr:MAG: hypothetical protein DRI65_03375 [Chloroflexota bacterium]